MTPTAPLPVGPLRGRPVQLAYAVHDVEAAAADWSARTGAGPFFVMRHIELASCDRTDGASGFDHSSAYGQWGDVMVELVREHSHPLVAPPGLHHVALVVENLPSALANGMAIGWPPVLRARTASGLEFAFLDARHALGHLVEVYEATQRLTDFYSMVREAARTSDGSEPVRVLR